MKAREDRPLVRVHADYFCEPLWLVTEHGVTEVSPASLGLSDALARDLLSWGKRYNDHLNRSDPSHTAWPSQKVAEAFFADGRRLAERVADELADYRVVFVSDDYGRLISIR